MAADLVVRIDGTPTRVFLGENTTLAAVHAGAARDAANDALNSAAVAEGAAGLHEYNSVAEGEAATALGDRFAVRTLDPGIVLVYERTSSGSLYVRAVLSAEVLAAPGGASRIGVLEGINARNRTQSDKNRDTFSLGGYAWGDDRSELAAIEACFSDAMDAGKDVFIPNGTFNGGGGLMILDRPVGFYGPGQLKNIQIQVGVAGGQVIWNKKFQATLSGASSVIDLHSVRNLDITMSFLGCDVAIHGTATSASAFHSISMISLISCSFIGCNRDIHLERDAGVNTLIYSDWSESGSYASHVKFEHFCWDQMDGILVSKITMLMPRGTVTRNGYRGKETEWAHFVAPVNLFECGEEAIYMEEIGVIKAADLGIAFCGQQVPASGIRIKNTTKFLNANITDNHIEKPTKHKVEIESAGAGWSGTIDGNTGAIDERVGSGANQTYFGTTALDTIPHYSVSTPTGSNRAYVGVNPGVYISIGGVSSRLGSMVLGTTGYDHIPLRYMGEGSIYRAVAVTGASVTILACDDIFGQRNSIDGEAYIVVKSADAADASVRSAQYRFLVHCGPDGNSIGTVEKLGDTAGANAASPSFTWAMSATKTLQASAVGVTNATFHFFASYRGNLKLRA